MSSFFPRSTIARRSTSSLGAVAQGLLVAAALVAVATPADAACVAGRSRSCTTEDGEPGTETCDGFNWGECTPLPSQNPPPTTAAPIGSLDVLSLDASSTMLTVQGWSIDTDTPLDTVQVSIAVDGQSQGWFPANQYRPDVGAVYPGTGTFHGYNAVVPVPAERSWGRHSVCVYGINTGTGSAGYLGCKEYVIEGKVTHTWGLGDVTRCVEDPIQAVNAVPTTGPNLGFVTSETSEGLSYSIGSPHLQGITRLAFGDGQRLIVSRSGSFQFYEVFMSDRNTSGAPFGSGVSASDFVAFRSLNDPTVGFDHAGGIQSLGTLVAIPNENHQTDDPNLPIEARTQIRFFDVSAPASPNLVGILGRDVLVSNEAGAVALARLASGQIVMAVGRTESSILDLYVSDGASPSDWNFIDTWTQPETQTTLPDGDRTFGDYQGLSFVTRCGDGALFLVGTHQDGDAIFGGDFVDLFRVEVNGARAILTKVAKRHIDCDQQCSLDAGGGVYVAPDGRLIVYGTEHAANGPDIGTKNTVKMREF